MMEDNTYLGLLLTFLFSIPSIVWMMWIYHKDMLRHAERKGYNKGWWAGHADGLRVGRRTPDVIVEIDASQR